MEHYYTLDKCTPNVEILSDGLVARGTAQSARGDDGILVTRQPLQAYRPFEFAIVSMPSGFDGKFEIGLTKDEHVPNFDAAATTYTKLECCDPSLPVHAYTAEHAAMFGIDDECMYKHGYTLGITIKNDNSLVLHVNGKNIPLNVHEEVKIPAGAKAFLTSSQKLYGVIRMSCGTTQISLTGRTQDLTSGIHESRRSQDTHTNLQDSVKHNMTVVVDFLQSIIEVDDTVAAALLDRHLLQPYYEHKDEHVRQEFGDHLAEVGVEKVLQKLDERLRSGYDKSRDYFSSLKIVRKLSWHYTEASLKFSRVLGQSHYLVDMFEALRQYGVDGEKDEEKKFLQYSSLAILYNSSNAAENRPIFVDEGMKETIFQFLSSSNPELSKLSFMSLVCMFGDVGEVKQENLRSLLGSLREALRHASLRRHESGEYGQFTAKELVISLGKIAAANDQNKQAMIKANAIDSLGDLLLQDDNPLEQEVTANTLVELSKFRAGKGAIASNVKIMNQLRSLESKEGASAVRDAAKRALAAIRNGDKHYAGSTATKEECPYAELCKRYKNDQLLLSDKLFEEGSFKCYCNTCHTDRGDALYRSCGNPGKEYGRPIGWYRFALKVPPRAEVFEAYKSWHIAFHGTSKDAVSPILESGTLLMPGDKTVRGNVLGHNIGRPTDENRDPAKKNHVFLSPSIRYAGHDNYALPNEYHDEKTETIYKAKNVFRVLVHPTSYEVGPASYQGGEDPNFSPQELEWSTDRRGSIVMYALLVNLEEKPLSVDK